jgi:hypothetical protein
LDLIDLLMQAALWLLGAVLVVLTFIVIRNEVTLDLHHSSTTATVIEVFEGGRGPGGLRVTFVVDARPIETTVEQPWFAPHFAVGQSVAIDYDPDDPTRARLADLHDVVSGLVFAGVVGATYWAIGRFRGRGRHRSRPTD